ncbi:hypothetical protein A2U01_0065929, partial [Trifolium medium]|nr:hypothetical protein [Trifolium medium]
MTSRGSFENRKGVTSEACELDAFLFRR